MVKATEMECMEPVYTEEEVALAWRRYSRTRDSDVRDRLIEHYLPVMYETVDRMVEDLPYGMEIDEMLRWGRVGLIEAVMRYAVSLEVPFEMFCVRYIRRAALDDMARFAWSRARRQVCQTAETVARGVRK